MQKCKIRETPRGALIIQLEQPYELIVYRGRWGYTEWRVRAMPPEPYWWRFLFSPNVVFFVCSKRSDETESSKKKRVVIEYDAVCAIWRQHLRLISPSYFYKLCHECMSCRTLDWLSDPNLSFLKLAGWRVVGISWTLSEESSFVAFHEVGGDVRIYEFGWFNCVDLVPP